MVERYRKLRAVLALGNENALLLLLDVRHLAMPPSVERPRMVPPIS